MHLVLIAYKDLNAIWAYIYIMCLDMLQKCDKNVWKVVFSNTLNWFDPEWKVSLRWRKSLFKRLGLASLIPCWVLKSSKASEKVLNLYSKASKYLAKCVTKYETAWPCVFNPLLSAPTSMASQKVSNHSRASKYM